MRVDFRRFRSWSQNKVSPEANASTKGNVERTKYFSIAFRHLPNNSWRHPQPKREAFYNMLREPSAFESSGIDRCAAPQSSVRTNVSGGTAEARFSRNVSYGHEAGVWISHRAARGTCGPIGAVHDE